MGNYTDCISSGDWAWGIEPIRTDNLFLLQNELAIWWGLKSISPNLPIPSKSITCAGLGCLYPLLCNLASKPPFRVCVRSHERQSWQAALQANAGYKEGWQLNRLVHQGPRRQRVQAAAHVEGQAREGGTTSGAPALLARNSCYSVSAAQ
jgi:hypothetical protein